MILPYHYNFFNSDFRISEGNNHSWCGRWLTDQVSNVLKKEGVLPNEGIISGLSNSYSSYVLKNIVQLPKVVLLCLDAYFESVPRTLYKLSNNTHEGYMKSEAAQRISMIYYYHQPWWCTTPYYLIKMVLEHKKQEPQKCHLWMIAKIKVLLRTC
jgi:hypothetical protein